MSPKFRRALSALGILLLLAVVQVTIIPLIGIRDVLPSVLLIGVVFVSLREGQLTAMLTAFPAGLLADSYLSGVVGISSLGLTITAFATGFFHDEEKASVLIRSPRVIAIMFLGASVYHLIYLFAYFRSMDLDILALIGMHVLGAAAYTTLLSTIPILLLARRAHRLKV
ncbi:MAG: rod shape-determining protein MreD [Bacteroidota bacterium]|nr:rod shape-determining protein MreD [Bacteroidota bacterium]